MTTAKKPAATAERLEKIEADRRNKLITESLAWRQASEIRSYVKAQLEHRKTTAGIEAMTILENWAAWALAEADRIDPLLKDAIQETAR